MSSWSPGSSGWANYIPSKASVSHTVSGTAIYASSYYYICVLILLYMCLQGLVALPLALWVPSPIRFRLDKGTSRRCLQVFCTVYVCIPLYMFPQTTLFVPSYYYICVLILLYMCPLNAGLKRLGDYLPSADKSENGGGDRDVVVSVSFDEDNGPAKHLHFLTVCFCNGFQIWEVLECDEQDTQATRETQVSVFILLYLYFCSKAIKLRQTARHSRSARSCQYAAATRRSSNFCHMCPHTTIRVLTLLCVLILLYMCPHITIYVSSYYFTHAGREVPVHDPGSAGLSSLPEAPSRCSSGGRQLWRLQGCAYLQPRRQCLRAPPRLPRRRACGRLQPALPDSVPQKPAYHPQNARHDLHAGMSSSLLRYE